MKTPKRKHCSYYSRAEMDIMRNRWKRKNREAQFKRTIAKYISIAWAWKREYEKLKTEILKTRASVQSILDGAEPYLDAVEHTACHDIEGS